MPKKKFSQAGLFLLSFLTTILFLSCSFLAASGMLQAPAAPQERHATPPAPELPSEQLRMTVLIDGREKSGYEPELFVLLGFLPDQGRIAVCALPPAVAVTAQGQQRSLQEWVRLGGISCAASALSEHLSLPIDHTMTVDTAGLSAVLKTAGTFRCNVREGARGKVHGHAVEIAPGVQALDGQQFADLLFYPGYSGGEQERADRCDVLLTQLVTHLLRAEGEGWGETLAESVFNHSNTSLSYPDYHIRKEALSFLSHLNTPAATPVFLEGAWNHTKTLYYLTSSCRERLRMVFQPPSIHPAEQPPVHLES